jgi:hypothetical protein
MNDFTEKKILELGIRCREQSCQFLLADVHPQQGFATGDAR